MMLKCLYALKRFFFLSEMASLLRFYLGSKSRAAFGFSAVLSAYFIFVRPAGNRAWRPPCVKTVTIYLLSKNYHTEVIKTKPTQFWPFDVTREAFYKLSGNRDLPVWYRFLLAWNRDHLVTNRDRPAGDRDLCSDTISISSRAVSISGRAVSIFGKSVKCLSEYVTSNGQNWVG